MQIDGFPVQGQEEIYLVPMGADPCLGGPDDGKGMASPDQGGIIMINIDPITTLIQEVTYNQRSLIDAKTGLAAYQNRKILHPLPPMPDE
jgi:hypothetical protein